MTNLYRSAAPTLLLIVLLLAGCTQDLLTEPELAAHAETPTLTAPTADKANPRERPHKGSYTVFGVDITVTFPSAACPAGFARVAFTGNGQATHLGNFLGEQTHCQNGSTSGILVQIDATQTAANGDQLFSVGSGTLVDNGDGTSTVTAFYTITGGTGRFADATGSYTSTGIQDHGTGDAPGTFVGGIAY